MRYDWRTIEYRYRRGETAYAISKSLGGKPTKQGIVNRAKKHGWAKFDPDELPAITPPKSLNSLGADTPQNRALILQKLSEGATLKLAAACAGISDESLRLMRKRDPIFLAECQAARAEHLTRKVAQVDKAGEKDWKAAAWFIDRSPEGRQAYPSGDRGSTLQLNIQINRDEPVAIDGEVVYEADSGE